jgi:hypothetical protein
MSEELRGLQEEIERMKAENAELRTKLESSASKDVDFWKSEAERSIRARDEAKAKLREAQAKAEEAQKQSEARVAEVRRGYALTEALRAAGVPDDRHKYAMVDINTGELELGESGFTESSLAKIKEALAKSPLVQAPEPEAKPESGKETAKPSFGFTPSGKVRERGEYVTPKGTIDVAKARMALEQTK